MENLENKPVTTDDIPGAEVSFVPTTKVVQGPVKTSKPKATKKTTTGINQSNQVEFSFSLKGKEAMSKTEINAAFLDSFNNWFNSQVESGVIKCKVVSSPRRGRPRIDYWME